MNVIFLQGKVNINAVSVNIYYSLCVFGAKLGKGSVNLAFVQFFKLHTHNLYILKHCTNIFYIFYFPDLNQSVFYFILYNISAVF